MASPSPHHFFGNFADPFRRLLGAAEAAEVAREAERSGEEDAEVAPRKKPPEWLSVDGHVMHGRWKGYNAAIWYPLKEKELVGTVDSIEEFRVVCRDEKAMYELLLPELTRFITPADLEQARIWKQRGARLRVHISSYQIVQASVIARTS